MLTLCSHAIAGRLSVTVQRSTLQLNETTELTVRVEGSRHDRLRIPSSAELLITPRGRSNEYRIVNGRRTEATIYTYELQPQKVGTVLFEAVSVQIDGETKASKPITLTVLPAEDAPAGNPELYITVSVSDTLPYVGEQISYVIRLHRRVDIGNAQLDFAPPSGVEMYELDSVQDFERVVDGHRYIVSEVRRALVPRVAGGITLEAPEIVVEVRVPSSRRGLFGALMSVREMRLLGEAVDLTVRSLPTPPAPFAGPVGAVALGAEALPDTVRLGESVNYAVTVGGRFTGADLPALELGETEGFRSYVGEPQSLVRTNSTWMESFERHQFALVAVEEGVQTVPAIELSYFDPDSEKYKSAVLPKRRITVVSDGSGPLQSELLEQGVLVDGDELRPNASSLGSERLNRSFPLQLLALVSPPLVVFGFWISQRRRRRWESDVESRRRAGARTKALEELNRVMELQDAEAVACFYRVVRCYIGDKLGLEGTALTARDIETQLSETRVDASLRDELVERLRWAERLRYGTEVEAIDSRLLFQEASQMILRLEQEL